MMMRKAVALRQVCFEDLGLLEPILRSRGYDAEYLDAGATVGAAQDADLVVVLGGPIGVYETRAYSQLLVEKQIVASRLERGRATLGICLGVQFMTDALGAAVVPTGAKEIG